MLGFITIQPTALDVLTFSPVLLPGDHQLVKFSRPPTPPIQHFNAKSESPLPAMYTENRLFLLELLNCAKAPNCWTLCEE